MLIISGVFTFAFTDQLAAPRPVFATTTVEHMIRTSITLNVSKRVIFVGENFSVRGFIMQQDGVMMIGYNVRVSWAINRSITLITDWDGSFAANLSFPAGFRQGFTNITANFGAGNSEYLPSSSFVQVEVIYRPSIITAEIIPARARPLDQVNVTGRLSGSDNQSLPNRSVTIKLDETVLGNATTDINGTFAFSFTVPEEMGNGTHSLAVFFNPNYDLYASSNTTLSLFIEPQTNATITTPTQTATQLPLTVNSVLSGTTLTVSGTAIAIAAILFSLAFKLKRRKPTLTSRTPEPAPNYPFPTLTGSVSETEKTTFSPKISQLELVSSLNLEKDDAAKVTRAYYLAQDLITERLGLTPEKNETHREYFDRVTKTAGYLKEPLREIVELFELARYTPNSCDAAQSSQAAEALSRLFQEIESRTVKTGPSV